MESSSLSSELSLYSGYFHSKQNQSIKSNKQINNCKQDGEVKKINYIWCISQNKSEGNYKINQYEQKIKFSFEYYVKQIMYLYKKIKEHQEYYQKRQNSKDDFLRSLVQQEQKQEESGKDAQFQKIKRIQVYMQRRQEFQQFQLRYLQSLNLQLTYYKTELYSCQ